jgi:hypothetical protein
MEEESSEEDSCVHNDQKTKDPLGTFETYRSLLGGYIQLPSCLTEILHSGYP